jgi:hypothetical protein
MKTTTCPGEEKLRKALARGGMDPALHNHVRQCPVCRDALLVSSWMRKFRDLTLDAGRAHRPVRDPQALWERALAGRTVDLGIANKALKPIYVYRRIAWLFSAVGTAVLVLLEFEKIKALLASLPGLDTLLAFLKKPAETGGGPLALAIAWAALGLATIIFLFLVTGMKRVQTRPKYSVHRK